MLYLSNTLRVLWPVIIIATRSGTPRRTRLRAGVRRKSWRSLSGTPAPLQADPCLAEVGPLRAQELWRGLISVREEVGDHPTQLALQSPHAGDLLGQEHLQLGRDVDDAPLAVLGDARLQDQRSGFEIDMAQAEGEHLALHPPAERVRDADGDLEILGQPLPHPLELLRLEEALTRRRLLELDLAKVRQAYEFVRRDRVAQHRPEHRDLSIDGAVGCALSLARLDVA